MKVRELWEKFDSHIIFQGAIKKDSSAKNGDQSNIKSKSKSSLSFKNSEDSEKVDLKLMRTSQTLEKRKDNDSHLRLTQNLQSSKNSTRYPLKSSRSLPTKESFSPTSKSNVNKSKMSSKSILTTKSSIEPIKPSSSNAMKNTKSSIRKIQSNYSEKRGLSTIFIPQSLTSKINTKSSNKSINSISKEEEKIRTHSNSSETTESKLKSKQRRLSRTLSPGEVKILHSASRLNSTQKTDQSKKEKIEIQSDNKYNYEDDFEVK